ncbi:hypothetical protein M0R36_04005 [bacterium]|jgi:hypothetical protein|nr:hypothetical protein [bacterium]
MKSNKEKRWLEPQNNSKKIIRRFKIAKSLWYLKLKKEIEIEKQVPLEELEPFIIEDIKAIKNLIKKHPQYNKLPREIKNKPEELESFAKEILASYKQKLSSYVKQKGVVKELPSLEKSTDLKIKEYINHSKKIKLAVSDLPLIENISDSLPEEIAYKPSNFIQKIDPAAFKKTKEDRHIEDIGKDIRLKHNKNLLEKHPDMLSSIYEVCYKDTKSIYSIAKNASVPYRKFLYIIKKLNLPTTEMAYGRKDILIDEKLAKSILEIYQLILKQTEVYSSWIKFLKRKKWSKSRISHFMKRKTDKGIVPEYYFEWIRPSRKKFNRIKKNVPLRLNEIFPDYTEQQRIPNLMTRKEILSKLKPEPLDFFDYLRKKKIL